ncbi:hypothetical protein L226DRAFT_538346 [Lentinus tigrinus ALCF2SS1-7]|uniref:MARVEL domain-containing protein n=1 Tax=Lentinus tigrinus ALCF2SS1-6 TaxID=1328759 RepID=A0A5C2S227_9APHY|nr:hypothetical protein L227DRAFT_578541 [Lentinus tigrinus ALCF2SS1-6]RPD71223.1 hypothetical protein L226DRAFT_538346 [Lentinus tigrinus ALCF2SS1-7]
MYAGRHAAISLASIYVLAALPSAQAYCYIDGFGRERCTLSTGARIGIAIASVAAVLILFGVLRSMRARATRRQNLAYVNTSAVAGAVLPAGPPPGYPPPGGYTPGYYPQDGGSPYVPPGGLGYAPQYPPQTYYSPQPGNVQQYAPPAGPPPGHQPQYAPPPGPPPFVDQKA